MSRRKKNKRQPEQVPEIAPKRKFYASILVAFLAGGLFVSTVAYAYLSPAPQVESPPKPNSVDSLGKLLALEDDELANTDIARMNLLCAEGLPGADALDVGASVKMLDDWAAKVYMETNRNIYKHHQNPEENDNSEAVYKMVMLITVLQQDFGIRYNKKRIQEVDFKNSQDLFINGMIGNDNGGTCVSMPVLYTAIARRLDYPVKLVMTKAHVFCRWEDENERFNIEATGEGFNQPTDDHYKTFPLKVTDKEIKDNEFLKSLTPKEELAVFLAARGHCLEDNKRDAESYVAYANAYKLWQTPLHYGFLAQPIAAPMVKQKLAAQRKMLKSKYRRQQTENYAERDRLARESQFNRQRNNARRDPFNPATPPISN